METNTEAKVVGAGAWGVVVALAERKRSPSEPQEQQGDELLHDFRFIGQLHAQVKGTGSLTPPPCSQAGGLGSGWLTW
ncbi:MAG: hypothetical protein VW622_01290 [Opitutae bacterium]